MIGVAVVGYGYWGPNLVRNFAEVPDVRLVWVCDLLPERLAGIRSRYPAVQTTTGTTRCWPILASTLSRLPHRSRAILNWLVVPFRPASIWSSKNQ